MNKNIFELVLDKLTIYINNNAITDYSKVENYILADEQYKSLDMDEQEVVLDMIKDKIEESQGKNKPTVTVAEKKFTSPKITPKKTSYANITPLEPRVIPPLPPVLSISDKEYQDRKAIFDVLSAIVLPEQRSKEWFEMRNNKITASDCGAVLGENKYEPSYNFIMKKVFGSTFVTNIDCYHGKKFENIVTLMYEYNYDTIVSEFGLLGHPDIYYLGASPDGICGPYKRDGVTRSELVGRMLEIKCPFRRVIKYSGEIKGEICPIYYWCQVQQQLECCNLPECDFVQVKIEEYHSRQEYLDDTSDEKEFLSKKTGFEKGILIELMPVKLPDEDFNENFVKDNIKYDKASFLYPPKLDLTNDEYNKWVMDELDKLYLKPHLRLNRVIYWKILERGCTLIKRDTEWFNKSLPKMREMWTYVEILRQNTELAEAWKQYIDAQPKKYNDKVLEKLNSLITEFNKKKLKEENSSTDSLSDFGSENNDSNYEDLNKNNDSNNEDLNKKIDLEINLDKFSVKEEEKLENIALTDKKKRVYKKKSN